ncbi:MAG: D-(-)-3-hydroxybutyrate oligomer hydrolase, partial [Nitrospiraceae bacterium]|nr:D-(-)-3-hydroxybutyrate oligomer hydrolase [Nitrospiraceae bacterium]
MTNFFSRSHSSGRILINSTPNLVAEDHRTAASSTFTARLSEAQRLAFDARLPNRFAFKHAHGQANPEADWGLYVLQSIEVAFWLLNQQYASAAPYAINRSNTLVIASSVSNGGGASLRAAEQDAAGLIDGVAVAEPNVQPTYSPLFSIRQGAGQPLVAHSRSLIDYITLQNVYAGCAAAQPALAAAPLNL